MLMISMDLIYIYTLLESLDRVLNLTRYDDGGPKVIPVAWRVVLHSPKRRIGEDIENCRPLKSISYGNLQEKVARYS